MSPRSIPFPWLFPSLQVACAVAANAIVARDTPSPKPIVIPASQNFEGNDGPWSSFTLQIGSPAQNVNVFISTAGAQTLPVAPQGCISSDPSNCAQLRGGLFDANQSTTWVSNILSPNKTDTFALGLETNLGYSANGKFGFDTVALGWQGSGGPSLEEQIVGGIATKDFYLGLFGLNPRPSNFSTFSDRVPSYMSNLKNQSLIPSLSWAYTAGNQYRLNKMLGSLTLGGYDASRFTPNNVTFAFNQQDIRDLTVNINAIAMLSEDGNRLNDLLPSPISAFVDSTIPYIYLPVEACRNFESAFGFIWNDTVQAYLVNDTLHDTLQSENASVRFTLGNSTSQASGLVDITLPYAAFDLIAESPLVANSTRYFPLVRATNESQYTLGRTFLQEAYLIADYERRNFSISQCSWVENAQQDIVAISAPSDNGTTSSGSKRLSSGAIAGIALGIFATLIISSVAAYFAIIRPRRNRRIKEDLDKSDNTSTTAELDVKERPLELDSNRRLGPEIDGKPLHGPELDSKPYLGEELDGKPHQGQELDGKTYLGAEIEGSNAWPQELGAKASIATELPA
ncbi:MAG: hypothetical protein Q9222_007543 [Ikaeria aurantiellina]